MFSAIENLAVPHLKRFSDFSKFSLQIKSPSWEDKLEDLYQARNSDHYRGL